MTAAGVSLRALQEIMGHSSSAMTWLYRSVMAETIIREMGKVLKVACNRSKCKRAAKAHASVAELVDALVLRCTDPVS